MAAEFGAAEVDLAKRAAIALETKLSEASADTASRLALTAIAVELVRIRGELAGLRIAVGNAAR